MIEKLKKTISDAGEAIKEQANNVSDAFKEKTYALIDDWLQIFPDLEAQGLQVMSFGLCMGISPALDVELRGKAKAFSPESIDKILDKCKGNNALTTVFKTIKTTYEWHRKTGTEGKFDAILIKLSVKITPEVKVYLGTPMLT